jgi:hypothetical protein
VSGWCHQRGGVGPRSAVPVVSGSPVASSACPRRACGRLVRHAHHPTGAGGPSGVRTVRRSATRTIRPAGSLGCGPSGVRAVRRSASRTERPAGRLAGPPVTQAHAPTAEGSFAGRIVGPGSQHHRREPRFGPSRPPIRVPSGGSVRPAHDLTGVMWSGTTPRPTSGPSSTPSDPPPVIRWSTDHSITDERTRERAHRSGCGGGPQRTDGRGPGPPPGRPGVILGPGATSGPAPPMPLRHGVTVGPASDRSGDAHPA